MIRQNFAKNWRLILICTTWIVGDAARFVAIQSILIGICIWIEWTLMQIYLVIETAFCHKNFAIILDKVRKQVKRKNCKHQIRIALITKWFKNLIVMFSKSPLFTKRKLINSLQNKNLLLYNLLFVYVRVSVCTPSNRIWTEIRFHPRWNVWHQGKEKKDRIHELRKMNTLKENICARRFIIKVFDGDFSQALNNEDIR